MQSRPPDCSVRCCCLEGGKEQVPRVPSFSFRTVFPLFFCTVKLNILGIWSRIIKELQKFMRREKQGQNIKAISSGDIREWFHSFLGWLQKTQRLQWAEVQHGLEMFQWARKFEFFISGSLSCKEPMPNGYPVFSLQNPNLLRTPIFLGSRF